MDKKNKRKQYSHTVKLECINLAEKYGNRHAGRHYNIDEACIRRWRAKKNQIRAFVEKGGMAAKSVRIKKGGRKVISDDLETQLFQWLQDKRDDNIRITTRMVQQEAKNIVTTNPKIREEIEQKQQSASEFQASRGWVRRFFNRHGLCIRRKTTQGQSRPDREAKLIRNFIIYVRGMRIQNNYPLHNIIAMDETAVWLDAPGDTTVHYRGERTVKVKTTSHEKNRVTVLLSAKANGDKVRPWVIFKGLLVIVYNLHYFY
jgi:hypothetical protein